MGSISQIQCISFISVGVCREFSKDEGNRLRPVMSGSLIGGEERLQPLRAVVRVRPAMRLPLLSPASLNPEQRTLYEDMREGIETNFNGFKAIDSDGALIGPWNSWLHFPKFGGPIWDLVKALSASPTLPRPVRRIEIAQRLRDQPSIVIAGQQKRRAARGIFFEYRRNLCGFQE